MVLQDILIDILTAMLSASAVVIAALILLSTLRPSVVFSIKSRIDEAHSKLNHYFLDWRSSFY